MRAPLFLCFKEDKLSPRNCTPPFLSFFNHGLYISLTTCRSSGILYDSFLENVQNILPLHSYCGRQYDCCLYAVISFFLRPPAFGLRLAISDMKSGSTMYVVLASGLIWYGSQIGRI